MQTSSPQPLPVHAPSAPTPQPSKHGSAKLMALVIVAIVMVLAATGFVVWVFVSRSAKVATVSVSPDDTTNVKSVAFVASPTLPPAYVGSNQAANGVERFYYYDDATNCGITTTIVQKAANKSAKDSVVDAINATYAAGVTTVKGTPSEQIKIKEAGDDGKQYTFDAVELEQQVTVPGVAFTAQVNTIAYKQFGSQVAAVSYSCKAETWAAKKVELTDQVKAFTVKTER